MVRIVGVLCISYMCNVEVLCIKCAYDMIVSLVYRYDIAACTYSNHSILQYRYGIQQNNTNCFNTYQNASTKNLPALFKTSSSTCCVLFINLTFLGLNNIAPSPNIGGPPAENASTCLIVVVVSRMVVHIIIVKKECVIVFVVCMKSSILCQFCGYVQSVNTTDLRLSTNISVWLYLLLLYVSVGIVQAVKVAMTHTTAY